LGDVVDAAQLEVPSIAADGRLDGKVAMVTGGGSNGTLAGTGAAIAVLFAIKGARVVVADRDAARADNTLRTIERHGARAMPTVVDITEPAGCDRAVSVALETFGALDILVNNAAIAPSEDGASHALWQQVLDLNLSAPRLLSVAAREPLARAGGAIVNIASVAGLRAGAGAAYSAAKSGLIGLTKAMAFEYGRDGVRVNAVAPGHVLTPMGLGYEGSGWTAELSGARRMRAEAGLLASEGTAWDIAYAALFLASDEARWITAVTLPVDAGTTEVMPIVMHPYLAAAAEPSAGA
jgi:NAD(P)-dependent dehydrogenase (short-subunit alcohol dehydrogenase family)